MEGKSAVVVGAGIAGLASALDLARHGWIVTVLEARQRVGGRICTVPSGESSAPIELGAEFIHGEKVDTWPFIRAAGLETHEMTDRRWRPAEQGLVDDSLESEDWQNQVNLYAPDQSFDDFLRHSPGLAAARSKLREYIAGFHAADPKRISAQAVAKSEQAADEIEGTRLFRISQGYGALVDWFRTQLEAAGGRVACSHVVNQVRWRPGQVDVEAQIDRQPTALTATAAIVTVPLGVLKAGGAACPRFEPELPKKAAALAGLAMGHVTKVVLQFRSRVWPADIAGFVHTENEWLPTWWAGQHGSVVTGWAGGPRARRTNAQDPGFLQVQALHSLAETFGLTAAALEADLEHLHVHDWDHDPFSCGAYSYICVGALDAPARLAEPVEGTLFFAGEATAADGQQGTVHGAIASGRRAAQLLLNSR